MYECYAWVTRENDEEGLIAAYIPEIGTISPLVARDLEIAAWMEKYAMNHHYTTGLPIRMIHLVEDTTPWGDTQEKGQKSGKQ
jgi:hypothetical protein